MKFTVHWKGNVPTVSAGYWIEPVGEGWVIFPRRPGAVAEAKALYECATRYVEVDEVARMLGCRRSQVHNIARRNGWRRRR